MPTLSACEPGHHIYPGDLLHWENVRQKYQYIEIKRYQVGKSTGSVLSPLAFFIIVLMLSKEGRALALGVSMMLSLCCKDLTSL